MVIAGAPMSTVDLWFAKRFIRDLMSGTTRRAS